MKFSILDLNPSATVEITGNEPWLEALYGDFPSTSGARPKVTGKLRLHRDESGSVQVTGHIDYSPPLPCSRCEQELQYPLSLDVEARFLPEDHTIPPREKNLSRADLDAYYLEGQSLDLEGLVNDVVQTAIPNRVVLADETGKSCKMCKADLTSDQLFGQGRPGEKSEGEKTSPFARLKGLKLPN